MEEVVEDYVVDFNLKEKEEVEETTTKDFFYPKKGVTGVSSISDLNFQKVRREKEVEVIYSLDFLFQVATKTAEEEEVEVEFSVV